MSVHLLSTSGSAHPVWEFLRISGVLPARSLAFLQRNGVTHIINVTDHLENVFEHCNIAYLRIPLRDRVGEDLPLSLFDDAFMFIGRLIMVIALLIVTEEAKRRKGVVLVHCVRGYKTCLTSFYGYRKSRSAAVVCAYLIRKYGMSVEQALHALREVRPIAQPNVTLMRKLREYSAYITTMSQQQ